MSRRNTVLGGVLLVGALIGAACGGDDSDDAATTTTGSATTAAGATSTSAATATTAGKQPATWAEWEQDGAQRRAAVVKRIKDNNWGLSADGKTLTGPEGFTVDLGACPSGWSNTEGLTDTNIKLGHTLAYSGTLAEYGNIGRGMENYMNYVNDTQGGIKDSTGKTRKMQLIQKDDGYDPARTIPLTDELLDSDKVFAITTGGSANVFRVYDKVNQRCVPQPMRSPGIRPGAIRSTTPGRSATSSPITPRPSSGAPTSSRTPTPASRWPPSSSTTTSARPTRPASRPSGHSRSTTSTTSSRRSSRRRRTSPTR